MEISNNDFNEIAMEVDRIKNVIYKLYGDISEIDKLIQYYRSMMKNE